MFCIAPYFDTDTILRATHFTCVSLILFGIAFCWSCDLKRRKEIKAKKVEHFLILPVLMFRGASLDVVDDMGYKF